MPTILVIDDDPAIRTALDMLLRRNELQRLSLHPMARPVFS